ncbi:MAG: helix-turn-helix domain-containing protein [Novosphingobium sp.]
MFDADNGGKKDAIMKIIKSTTAQKITPAKVVPIGTKGKADSRKASERKFGKPVMDLGFCIVPSLLMWAQARLGINPVQFNIIMQFADMWWDPERKPWPTKKLLSDRIGLSERQIQRQIAALEVAGLVTRIERTRPGRGKTSNEYDLTGLVSKLKKLEPEFTAMKEENTKRRKNVALPQHRRKA